MNKYALLLLLLASPLLAMDTPVMGGSPGSPSAATSQFNYIHATNAWDSNALLRQSVIPFDLSLSSLSVVLQVAPGAGTQRDFVIRQNGNDTTLGCSVIDAAVSCSSFSAVAFAKGDIVDIKATPINTPASAANVFFSVMASASVKEALLITASAVTVSTITTVCAPVSGAGHPWDPSYTIASGVVAAAGKIRNAYVSLSASPGAGKSRTFTWYLNGSPTSLAVTIADAATTGEDSANEFTVSPGDTVATCQSVTGANPSASRATWASKFVPDTDGESFVAFVTSTTLPTSGTNFTYANGAAQGTTYTTEPSRRQSYQAAQFSNFYGILGTAPGAGKSYAFTLRNAGADSAVTFSIADGNTTGSDTSNSFTPVLGALSSLKVVASGTPTSSVVRMGYRMFVTPTAVVTTTPQRALTGVGR